MQWPAINSSSPARAESVPSESAPIAVDQAAYAADAAEELTFQFSEVVESRQRTLEDRLQAGSEPATHESMTIEQVHSLMRLMEGREAYDHLRAQARAFAQAVKSGSDEALQLLLPQSMPAQKRYAILRLCIDSLQAGGDADKAQRLRAEHGALLREPSGWLAEVGRPPAPVSARDAAQDRQEAFVQLLGTRPTARSLFDAAAALDASPHLLGGLDQVRSAWRGLHSPDTLAHVGAIVAVNQMVLVVRSMIGFAGELMAYAGMGEGDARQDGGVHARTLIDLANSAVPSPVLDKLATAILGAPRQCTHCAPRRLLKCAHCTARAIPCTCAPPACRCIAPRSWLFSFLHQQVRRWPEPVWTLGEAKALVLQQLVRKQAAS